VTLSREDVRHVALLARLGLEPGEEDFYAGQLSAILAHIDRLRELDTEAIPPTAQVVPLENRLREDEPRPGLTQERALANAPEARDGCFVVRAIQEEAES
jgi:aspartyl-tRNA(Asn)/glutamyl-tRNA(Gln) amidotransferase subunit C